MSQRLTLIPITALLLLTVAGCGTRSPGSSASNNQVTSSPVTSSAANGGSHSTFSTPPSPETTTSTPETTPGTPSATRTSQPPSTTAAATSQLSSSLATRMKNVAGISNPAAFVQSFKQLQTDVAQGNKAKVAAFGDYPIDVNQGGKTHTISNAQAFVQHYNTIMTSKVKSAITSQSVNQFFVNYEGVMVGNGQVWLTQSGSSKCSIYAINH